MVLPDQVWLVLDPMDMRLGIDGLSSRLQQTLGRSPCDGTAYAFRNRRGTRLKLLQWDAMDYSLKRWPALSRYAPSGDLPIDNNPVENVIRPIAVGKKNWLFTGS
jgi:hypothetical protein